MGFCVQGCLVTRFVLVESPFAGPLGDYDPIFEKYARRCMRDCFARREAPLASHILYAMSEVLDDKIPSERLLGINAGLAWARAVNATTVVYTDFGESAGMMQGIDAAMADGRKVEYRTIGKR